MDVDTRLLRYFAAVAEEGNLTRAAERLFVSQPALTKQVRQLESQLGVQLFTRSRAGMSLTAAGQELPLPGQETLRVETLFTEPRWVVLRADHPLAARDVIAFADLWDEPFVAAPGETGWWRDWWLAADEREGHPVLIGAVTDSGQPDDRLTAIANGHGVALAPESGACYYARPGIAYRPVTGVSPSQVGVAWPPHADANPVVQDFIQCCRDSKSDADRQ